MEIKVLFNSSAQQEGLSIGWGLSLLIDKNILFDTGEKQELFDNNIHKLNVDLSLIKSVIISHDHWDHTGGLWGLLEKNPTMHVYGCPGFGVDFAHKLSRFPSIKYFKSDHFTRITKGMYSTGEMIGTYKGKNISEQSLIVKTEKGVSVITGCAHPGIIKILERVQSQLSCKKFYSVLGGFHLKNSSMSEIEKIVETFSFLKVQKVGVTHCSGDDAEKIFKKVYKNNFFAMSVGKKIII